MVLNLTEHYSFMNRSVILMKNRKFRLIINIFNMQKSTTEVQRNPNTVRNNPF